MQSFKLFLAFALICIVEGKLEDHFHYYEIIDSVKFHTITKRSTNGLHTKQMNIAAFGKNFTLQLHPSTDLFSPNFKITVIHSDNSEEEVEGFNKNNFLTGVVVGEKNSKAALHVDDDGVVTGVFTEAGQEYVIEPISTYQSDESDGVSSDGGSMVTYRRTDIKTTGDGAGLCGSIHPENTTNQFDEIAFQPLEEDFHHRQKRSTAAKACRIITVADYKFYAVRGNSNIFTTANFMANIINSVNRIYRSTGFSTGSGYGFEIERMFIHDRPTTAGSGKRYNIQKTNWGTVELLEAFSEGTDYSGFCLAHLFTAQSMANSVLGLAYIASSRTGTLGGICSQMGTVNGVSRKFNTGWTSSLNLAGSTVSFTQNYLVTAHEFGHNLGSEHDPNTDECAPGTFLDDGKYLMYSYSVTGEDPNNDEFSRCSRRYISAVIANKAAGCFKEFSPVTLCGNGRLDSGEECDGGFLGKVNLDPCCTPECTLAPGAVCSISNYPCCTNCQLASPGLQCQADLTGSCQGASFCNGNDLDCPTAPNKPDNTGCLDGGSCRSGVCLSYCEFRGFNSCVCDTVDTSCKVCCRGQDGICQVQDITLFVADGRSCVQGYCANGVCIKVADDLVERFWEFIDSVDIDYIVESFKTNMVGCVIGFSLVIYLPICITIWCVDKKRKKDWKKQNAVHIRTDRGLAHDEDKRPIGMPERPKTSRGKPATLNPSEYLEPVYGGRPSSRNQIQPIAGNSGGSRA